jgi:sarcosine oxidase subunit alpha
VRLTSVTDHWAVLAVAGPRSRAVIAALVPGLTVDAASLPFMAIRDVEVAGASARLCRVSFSGELAFEIHAPARYALAAWEAAMAAGEGEGITPYGMEALHVLRAEKGYVIVGQDTDGTVTPQDAGLDWLVSRKKDFFMGRRSHRRPHQLREDRRQLVGLFTEDPELVVREGAPLLADSGTAGHVTSSYASEALGRSFAMALLAGGHRREGETVRISLDDERVARAVVTGTVFYDPEGERRDGDPSQRD